MNFEDEAYVRLFLRDTINWKMLNWQGKCVLPLLFRKVDRAGVLDLGDYAGEMARVVAALIEIPEEVVEPGLAAIFRQKSALLCGQYIVLPNFIEAQEAIQSDRVRKAEQRARHRDRSLAIARGLVTPRDIPPPASAPTNGAYPVTPRDATDEKPDDASRGVTKSPADPPGGHSSCAEPTLAEPSRAELAPGNDDKRRAILDELRRHRSLGPVANEDVAHMLMLRFTTNEMHKVPPTKLEWVIQAIRDCAADVAGLGLKAEFITRKLRAYCDNARAPKKPQTNGANGHARYAPTDAVIESKKRTRAEQEDIQKKQRERAEALEAERKKREALEKKKPDPTEPTP